MPCVSPNRARVVAILVVALVRPLASGGQTPAPTSVGSSASIRSPTTALTQPVEGGTLPQDRPVLAFRFAAVDASDPLDLASFRVSVDGRDRTTAFQVTPNDAWGKLEALSSAPGLAAGPHSVVGRICTVRGTCGSVSATVAVVAMAQAESQPNAPNAGPKGLIGALVKLTRKIVGP